MYCTASDRPSNQREYSAKSHPVPHQPDIKERVEINILLIAFIVEIMFVHGPNIYEDTKP
jgi:hypothetical protein